MHVYIEAETNCYHFTDNIINCILLNENAWIFLKTSLAFVPKVGKNNIPALVQIMTWCKPGRKRLSKLMMWVYWCTYVSLGLSELRDILYTCRLYIINLANIFLTISINSLGKINLVTSTVMNIYALMPRYQTIIQINKLALTFMCQSSIPR